MHFAPIGHFSGDVSQAVDLATQLPWLYVIACPNSRLLYVGETYAQGGVIGRLANQFGLHQQSTLRRAAARITGISSLEPPYIVIAAELPCDDDEVRFDASSKHVRHLCESIMHRHVAEWASRKGGWVVVSSSQAKAASETEDIVEACRAISSCFETTMDFLLGLTLTTRFHFVVVSRQRNSTPTLDIGDILKQTEVILFEWIVRSLQKAFGSDWWTRGVPLKTREECRIRAEREGQRIEPEAYFNFIDLREIVQFKWDLFNSSMEKISKRRGKRPATEWLVELNEVRNIWAHPIKQKFRPVSADQRDRIGLYLERVRSYCDTDEEIDALLN